MFWLAVGEAHGGLVGGAGDAILKLAEGFPEGVESSFQLNATHAELSFLSLQTFEGFVGLHPAALASWDLRRRHGG